MFRMTKNKLETIVWENRPDPWLIYGPTFSKFSWHSIMILYINKSNACISSTKKIIKWRLRICWLRCSTIAWSVGNGSRKIIIGHSNYPAFIHRGRDTQSPVPVVKLVLICKAMGICLIFVNIKQIPIALQIKTGLTIGIGIGCPTVCSSIHQ